MHAFLGFAPQALFFRPLRGLGNYLPVGYAHWGILR